MIRGDCPYSRNPTWATQQVDQEQTDSAHDARECQKSPLPLPAAPPEALGVRKKDPQGSTCVRKTKKKMRRLRQISSSRPQKGSSVVAGQWTLWKIAMTERQERTGGLLGSEPRFAYPGAVKPVSGDPAAGGLSSRLLLVEDGGVGR